VNAACVTKQNIASNAYGIYQWFNNNTFYTFD
jgi:hypothetical protein